MNAVRGFTKGYLVVCTYPEALAERIVDAEALNRGTIAVRVGDRISIEVLEQELVDAAFTRVDFVYEPGQYSVRGASSMSSPSRRASPTVWISSATRSIRSGASTSRASFRPTNSNAWRSSPT